MKLEDAFSKDEVYDEYDKPSDEEWVKIETFSKLVGCIYKVAVELFEGGYSTSNVYFHLLAELKVILEKELEGADSDYFRCKAKGMLKRFDKYWNQMFLVLASACVLDPRFKLKYVEFYCSKKIENDEGSNAETVLDYLRKFLKFEGSSPREFGESELDAYLKEPVMEWNKDFKALEWWREDGGHKYPILSRVARDILSIPISRVTSYDAYVTGKREPPAFVVSLEAKVANAMMCSKKWLRL
ncbi:zinc finger BED domain-containing protein RICESLEEPER 3-like [Brassica napus]|uniref:zinc finger BED domain-containing protein RICESLEEPER 3-like n=1 Tax=Brassica oleracea var. oleracea TaxID=109376 RepID=UPI0006A74EC4|nr:PREDICTED: zinc finger BED domain-containing protein RICESLEEPER 3-like [Brassica oleracea var. oleracea]XP_013713444.1 zinc finger BED domain-containing protein RICESLEEPER 3-like [Brassica napus]